MFVEQTLRVKHTQQWYSPYPMSVYECLEYVLYATQLTEEVSSVSESKIPKYFYVCPNQHSPKDRVTILWH